MGKRKASRVVQRKGNNRKNNNGSLSLGTNLVGTVSLPSTIGSVSRGLRRTRYRDLNDSCLGPGVEVVGTELLGYARVAGTGASTGDACCLTPSDTNSQKFFYIAPMYLSNGTIATFGSLFGLYRFREIRIRYVPAVGTATAVSIVMAVQFDPGHGGEIFTIQNIMYSPYVAESPIWQPVTLDIPNCMHFLNAYYTDPGNIGTETSYGTQRMSTQAVLAAFVDNSTATLYGRFYLDYRIEFYQRGQLVSHPLALSLPLRTLYPKLSESAKKELQALSMQQLKAEISTSRSDCQKVDIFQIAGNLTSGMSAGETVGLPVDLNSIGGVHSGLSAGLLPVVDYSVSSLGVSDGVVPLRDRSVYPTAVGVDYGAPASVGLHTGAAAGSSASSTTPSADALRTSAGRRMEKKAIEEKKEEKDESDNDVIKVVIDPEVRSITQAMSPQPIIKRRS